jgi:uncharacterized protein
MEENLDLALQRIFGGRLPKEREVSTAATPEAARKESTDRQLAIEALSHYRKAQEYLRANNWSGYGEELKRMDDVLRTIEKKR